LRRREPKDSRVWLVHATFLSRMRLTSAFSQSGPPRSRAPAVGTSLISCVRYPWGFHPIQNLSVWHLGRLSAALPVTLLFLLVASWRWRKLCEPATLVRITLGVCMFTVLYAVECGLALMIGERQRDSELTCNHNVSTMVT